MRRSAGEVVWRVKLIVGLAALGGLVGGLLRAAWLAAWPDWIIPQWARWVGWLLTTSGWASDLALYAAIGAGVFVAPFIYLFFFKRG